MEAVLNGRKAMHIDAFLTQIKNKSDKLINYFLICYLIAGLGLSLFYETEDVAIGVGGLSLLAYYATKYILTKSNLYQYVLSTVFGIFMAQYIYQMHGLFEMHFVAFIGSAILITYQNWKLQIPIVLVVVVHHAVFGYLQFTGVENIYFTQLEYMDLQTFVIHVFLAAVIFFTCGLWAHHFKKYSERHIEQTFETGRLLEEQKQKEALLEMSENLKKANERLNEAQKIASIGSWSWDIQNNYVHRSEEFYHIMQRTRNELPPTYEAFLNCVHPDDMDFVKDIVSNCVSEQKPISFETRVVMPDGNIKTLFAQGKAVENEEGELSEIHGTIQDITARKIHETALQQTNEELRKSNHELDKFVYSVSHDLRAPLLSMQGVVEITAEESEEELTKEHMKMLQGSIGRLDNFIGDILNYSRNARGEVRLKTVDFKQMLSEITHDLRYMVNETKKVSISVDIDQNGTFHSDDGRCRIILNNLISNAIRYHNPQADQPFVKIKARADESMSLIEIEDNGIGIPKQYQEKVFEMFYRVSETSTGSGLGLYIVKETIDKLKGEIRIESEPGVGTKCFINIPNLSYQ
jgi:PAS domain S-box-containing protein